MLVMTIFSDMRSNRYAGYDDVLSYEERDDVLSYEVQSIFSDMRSWL